MGKDTLNEELRLLKERLDRGEITEASYEKAVQRLRDAASHARP